MFFKGQFVRIDLQKAYKVYHCTKGDTACVDVWYNFYVRNYKNIFQIDEIGDTFVECIMRDTSNLSLAKTSLYVNLLSPLLEFSDPDFINIEPFVWL